MILYSSHPLIKTMNYYDRESGFTITLAITCKIVNYLDRTKTETIEIHINNTIIMVD